MHFKCAKDASLNKNTATTIFIVGLRRIVCKLYMMRDVSPYVGRQSINHNKPKKQKDDDDDKDQKYDNTTIQTNMKSSCLTVRCLLHRLLIEGLVLVRIAFNNNNNNNSSSNK